MNKSVIDFYNKEENLDYYKKYREEHAPRLDFAVKTFSLDQIKNEKVGDFGCGAGFLLEKLDNSNQKYGFDGAYISKTQRLCDFDFYSIDLDLNFANVDTWSGRNFQNSFDKSFCFETLEHLAAPYNALSTMKWMTKENGDIYISIPDQRVTHNVVYPSLMFPHTNFEEFLEQMALPIQEHVVFEGGWPAQIWKVKNAPWSEKKLKYPKPEGKFRGCTPLEATNL